MALDPGQSNAHQDPPISHAVARQIAGTFNLPVRDILTDARQVSMWVEPADDLLVSLEHRHGFRARAAVAYLLSLRSALQRNTS
jgi:hypothetical protein